MEQTQKERKDTLLTLSWSTPQILPGPGTPLEQTSTSPPAITVYSSDSNAYVAFRLASNDAIWINYSSDGQTWSKNDCYAIQKTLSSEERLTQQSDPQIDMKLYTLHRPSITNYNSALYLAYTNKADSTVYLYKSSNPTSSGWTYVATVPTPSTPLGAPSIASFNNGRLYLAYTEASTYKVMVGNYDVTTNSWSTFAAVQKSSTDITSSDAPCLWSVTSGSINYRLYLCIRTINETYLGYASIDTNGDITSWNYQITSNPVTPFSIVETPQVSQYSNDFYMTVAGPKNDIRYGVSTNEGQTFPTWNSIDNATTGSPATIQQGSQITMVFTQDNRNSSKAYVMSCFGTFS